MNKKEEGKLEGAENSKSIGEQPIEENYFVRQDRIRRELEANRRKDLSDYVKTDKVVS